MRKAPTFRFSPEPFPHAPYSCRQQNLRCPDFCPYYDFQTQPIEITWFSDRHFWHGGYDKAGKGNCYDNAMVETFFKTLKSELVWRTVFYTREQADRAIGRYIDGFYNPVRRHSALDFTSPAQFEKHAAK